MPGLYKCACSAINIVVVMFLSLPLLGLTDYGWCREDGQLRVTWDTAENVQQVQCSVQYLTQGCKCKTGCTSRRCGCMKAELECGLSCKCVNCRNTSSYTPLTQETEEELQEETQEDPRGGSGGLA